MHFSKLTIASLFAGVLASPAPLASPDASPIAEVVEEAGSELAKRAEGVHLVNCLNKSSGQTIYSVVVYCANDSNCNFNPGPGNSCVPSPGGVRRWEGSSQSCTFSTGTTFSWNIVSNAQSLANFVKVGDGDNGFRTFQIFKDDKHTMYTDGNGYACQSIYYSI